MSDDETRLINNPRSFEARVLAQLDDVSSRLAVLEKREDERNSGVERLVSEFQDMNINVKAYLASFDEKLDVINSELLQVKADQRVIERRMRKMEAENRPQVITQEKQF